MRIRSLIFSIAISFIFFIGGCVTVPKASVELSSVLTGMINSSRQSHLRLLDEYTALRKAEVDRFLEKEWVPAFTSNFVQESGILDNIQAAPTNAEKGAEILEFAQAALPIIAERRKTMMDVVEEIDQIIRREIEAHYQEMINVNLAVTAHLRSAADVVQAREDLQKQLNIDVDEMVPLDQVNQTMEKLLSAGTKAEEIPGMLNEFKTKLNTIRNGKAK